MGQVIVRNLDDSVIETFRERAAQRGVSLEQQLREVLAEAARGTPADRVERMRRIRAQCRPGDFPTAEQMVREDRDSR